jgi:hypothetical protein
MKKIKEVEYNWNKIQIFEFDIISRARQSFRVVKNIRDKFETKIGTLWSFDQKRKEIKLLLEAIAHWLW